MSWPRLVMGHIPWSISLAEIVLAKTISLVATIQIVVSTFFDGNRYSTSASNIFIWFFTNTKFGKLEQYEKLFKISQVFNISSLTHTHMREVGMGGVKQKKRRKIFFTFLSSSLIFFFPHSFFYFYFNTTFSLFFFLLRLLQRIMLISLGANGIIKIYLMM